MPKFDSLRQLARRLRSSLFLIRDGAVFIGTFRDHNIMYDWMISREIGGLGKGE